MWVGRHHATVDPHHHLQMRNRTHSAIHGGCLCGLIKLCKLLCEQHTTSKIDCVNPGSIAGCASIAEQGEQGEAGSVASGRDSSRAGGGSLCCGWRGELISICACGEIQFLHFLAVFCGTLK